MSEKIDSIIFATASAEIPRATNVALGAERSFTRTKIVAMNERKYAPELLAELDSIEQMQMEKNIRARDVRAEVAGELTSLFEGLDIDDLMFVVKRIGRGDNIVPRLRDRGFVTDKTQGEEANLATEAMFSVLIEEIYNCMNEGELVRVARACIAAAHTNARTRGPGICRHPDGGVIIRQRTLHERAERADSLTGIGNAILDAHRSRDAKSKPILQHGKLGRPTSRLTDDAKRVMLEWGTYSLEKLQSAGILDMNGSEFNKTFDRVLDEVTEEFKKVTNNKAIDEPEPEYSEQARVWIQTPPSVGFRWALNGFPFVVPSHKLAASLMATYLPPEHARELKLPWETFFIAVPNGMFEDEDPKLLPRMVGITNDPYDGMRLIVFFAAGAMARIETVESLAELSDFKPSIDDYVARFIPMLARLVLGCIVEMDHPERKAEVAEREAVRDATEQKKSSKKASQPTAWAFELKRDVRVDLRDWVRDQVSRRGGGGNRKLPAVRILVRGHHKRQPYGIGGLLRKWIHVEPYWRGDESAPVAVRSHVLKSGRD